MKNITLKEIANELGLSISTISKGLNNSSEISEKTREKIQAFAKLYNYNFQNDSNKNNLSITKTIGVVIPEIGSYFTNEIIKGIESICYDSDYKIIICPTNGEFHKEVEQIEMLVNNKVNGIVLLLGRETQRIKNYQHLYDVKKSNIPFVLINNSSEELHCDKVIIDDLPSVKNALKYLLDVGVKQVGIITSELLESNHAKNYIKAINDLRLQTIEKEQILYVEKTISDAEKTQQIENYLNANPLMDAMIILDESLAFLIDDIIYRKGKNKTKTIHLVQFFNGVRNAEALNINRFGRLVGENTGLKLLERIHQTKSKQNPFETIIIKTELIKNS